MTEQIPSSLEHEGFQIGSKVNRIFIILILVSAIPIMIGLVGLLDQATQPNIVYTAMTGDIDARYTINLKSNTMYYITISPGDTGMTRDFTAVLSFFKNNVEIYHDTVQQPQDSIQKGIIYVFDPFISDTEGSYIIDCSITYIDNSFPFYIRMQKAAGISQITGYSGEEILGLGLIIFLAIVVLLIIVSLIARVKYTTNLRKHAIKSDELQNEFVWSSKNENKDT